MWVQRIVLGSSVRAMHALVQQALPPAPRSHPLQFVYWFGIRFMFGKMPHTFFNSSVCVYVREREGEGEEGRG